MTRDEMIAQIGDARSRVHDALAWLALGPPPKATLKGAEQLLDNVLAALRAPEGGTEETCAICDGPVVDTPRAQACVVGRYDVAVCGGCCAELATPPTPPPADLVGRVERFQRARLWALADLGTSEYREAVDEFNAAKESVLVWTPAAPVPAPPITREWCEAAAADEATHGDADCTTGAPVPAQAGHWPLTFTDDNHCPHGDVCVTSLWCNLGKRCLACCAPEDADAPLERRVPAQAGDALICKAHSIRACMVCMMDEAFAPPLVAQAGEPTRDYVAELRVCHQLLAELHCLLDVAEYGDLDDRITAIIGACDGDCPAALAPPPIAPSR